MASVGSPRAAVADDTSGAALVTLLNGLRRKGFQLGGDQLKPVPRPWDDTRR